MSFFKDEDFIQVGCSHEVSTSVGESFLLDLKSSLQSHVR